MLTLLLGIGQKIAAVILLPFTAVGGFITHPKVITIVPPQPAIVSALPAEIQTTSAPVSSTSPTTTTVQMVSAPPATTTSSKITKNKETPAKTPVVAAAPVPSSTPAPRTITAKWLLDNAELATNQRIDGSFWLSFTVKIGAQKLNWDLTQDSVGGTGGVPKYALTYSCTPPPDTPAFDATDFNPVFEVKTAYNCNTSLNGAGNDQYQKDFQFRTGNGRFVVTTAAGMSTVLQDGKNVSGFVFDNQDTSAVNISAITFDASFTALSTTTTPLILRFADSITGESIVDYHLENLPSDLTSRFTYSQANINLPLPFVIGPRTKRMLLVQALGVNWTNPGALLGDSESGNFISSISPTVKITLKNLTTDNQALKSFFNSNVIVWSCILSTQQYNPYSTSSQALSDQACK